MQDVCFLASCDGGRPAHGDRNEHLDFEDVSVLPDLHYSGLYSGFLSFIMSSRIKFFAAHIL